MALPSKPEGIRYTMVTVRLDHAETDRQKAFEQIKQTLEVSTPAIDESFGAIRDDDASEAGTEYTVLIESGLAQKLTNQKHPNVLCVYANPKLSPFDAPSAAPKPPR